MSSLYLSVYRTTYLPTYLTIYITIEPSIDLSIYLLSDSIDPYCIRGIYTDTSMHACLHAGMYIHAHTTGAYVLRESRMQPDFMHVCRYVCMHSCMSDLHFVDCYNPNPAALPDCN